MDIIIGEGRRRWSEEEKRAIVSEVMTSVDPSARSRAVTISIRACCLAGVSATAMRWGKTLSTSARPITFAPAMILGDPAAEPSDRKAYPSHDHCVVELDFESGARLRVYASADANLVKAVIEAMTHQ